MFVPDGVPPSTRTLYCPSLKVPSVVVRVCEVPARVIVPTPFRARSMISKLLFEVAPQVPACSPEPGFSIPELFVYVLGIYTTFCVQMSTIPPALISVHVPPVGFI